MKTKKVDFPIDQFVLIQEDKGVGTFVYVPSGDYEPLTIDATIDYGTDTQN
jgi:hypothetical protein